MEEISVNSGEFHVSRRSNICLQTVVGACVSVCILDREHHYSGLCHYRLPSASQGLNTEQQPYDYGDTAIKAMLQQLKRQGCHRQNLEAWIIGGGNLSTSSIPLCQQIGLRNIAIAFRVLAEFGIPVVGTAIGGDTGRQIRFMPGQTEVLCRPTHPMPVPESHELDRTDMVDLLTTNPTLASQVRTSLRHLIPPHQLCHQPQLPAPESRGRLQIIDESWLFSAGSTAVQALTSNPTVLLLSHDACPPAYLLEQALALFGPQVFISSWSTLPKVVKAALRTPVMPVELNAQDQALGYTLCQQSVVLIGSSTGGIDALDKLVRQLPATMPPICIVQHLPEDYTNSLTQALSHAANLTVCRAQDGMQVQTSTIYVAPGDQHMTLSKNGHQLVLRLKTLPPVNGFIPSVDMLMLSAAKLDDVKVTAALLTGMGHDGAQGMLALKQAGATTLAQDEHSSVVYGMARTAQEIGAVTRLVPLENMGQAIVESVMNTSAIHVQRHAMPTH